MFLALAIGSITFVVIFCLFALAELTAVLGADALGDFLRELQSGSKAVVVTRWGIVAAGNPEKSLNVNLTISGIVRQPAQQE